MVDGRPCGVPPPPSSTSRLRRLRAARQFFHVGVRCAHGAPGLALPLPQSTAPTGFDRPELAAVHHLAGGYVPGPATQDHIGVDGPELAAPDHTGVDGPELAAQDPAGGAVPGPAAPDHAGVEEPELAAQDHPEPSAQDHAGVDGPGLAGEHDAGVEDAEFAAQDHARSVEASPSLKAFLSLHWTVDPAPLQVRLAQYSVDTALAGQEEPPEEWWQLYEDIIMDVLDEASDGSAPMASVLARLYELGIGEAWDELRDYMLLPRFHEIFALDDEDCLRARAGTMQLRAEPT